MIKQTLEKTFHIHRHGAKTKHKTQDRESSTDIHTERKQSTKHNTENHPQTSTRSEDKA